MAMMILIFKATLDLRKNLVWYVIDKDKGVCGPIVGLGDASKPIKQFLKDTIGNTIVKHALIRISSPHRSWPAVSQICSLIFSPSISTVLIIKSTPMVAPCPGGNMPWKWHSYFSREEWVTNKQAEIWRNKEDKSSPEWTISTTNSSKQKKNLRNMKRI